MGRRRVPSISVARHHSPREPRSPRTSLRLHDLFLPRSALVSKHDESVHRFASPNHLPASHHAVNAAAAPTCAFKRYVRPYRRMYTYMYVRASVYNPHNPFLAPIRFRGRVEGKKKGETGERNKPGRKRPALAGGRLFR